MSAPGVLVGAGGLYVAAALRLTTKRRRRLDGLVAQLRGILGRRVSRSRVMAALIEAADVDAVAAVMVPTERTEAEEWEEVRRLREEEESYLSRGHKVVASILASRAKDLLGKIQARRSGK